MSQITSHAVKARQSGVLHESRVSAWPGRTRAEGGQLSARAEKGSPLDAWSSSRTATRKSIKKLMRALSQCWLVAHEMLVTSICPCRKSQVEDVHTSALNNSRTKKQTQCRSFAGGNGKDGPIFPQRSHPSFAGDAIWELLYN